MTCNLDTEGVLVDGQGLAGVWLVTGTYRVDYMTVTGGTLGLAAHDIVVTDAHTESSPLDLVVAAPPGGQVLAASQFAALSARIDQLGDGGGSSAAVIELELRTVGYADLGTVSGAVTINGQGTVAMTLSGPTSITLDGVNGDSVLLDVDLAGHAVTVNGQAVTLSPTVWVRSRGRWVTGATTGSGEPVETPDTIPPTAGTLSVAAAQTTADLSVSGALDNEALHATPYSFSKDGGTTWNGWKSAGTHQFTALTPGTEYVFAHRVRDAAGNIRQGAPVTRSTTTASALTMWAADDFTSAVEGADLDGRITPTGGQQWTASTDNPPGSLRRSTAQTIGGLVDLNGSWQGVMLRLPMTAPVTDRVVITADYTITAGILALSASGSQGGTFPPVGAQLRASGSCAVGQSTSATWTTSSATPAPASGTATLTVTRKSSGEATMTLSVNETTVLTASSSDAFPFGQRVYISNDHEGRATVDNIKVEYK